MGLTLRKDSYYVQFPVKDDGTTLTLARGTPGSRLMRWKVGCRNKEVAKAQEAIIKKQLLEGTLLTPEPVAPLVTVREYVQRWLVRAQSTLAAKTLANYTQILTLYILPSLGNQNLKSLTWVEVKGLLNEKQQGGLSVNTTRLIRAVISTVLTDAADDNLISANPLMGQKRKRRASQAAIKVYPFTWEQKQAFETQLTDMEAIGALTPSYVMLLRLSLMTGLRPSEGRALIPGDLDFHGHRLRVERAADLNGKTKETKTGETRWVDLSDGLMAQLKSYMMLLRAEDVARGKESIWLFPSLTGTLLDERHVVRAFHRVLEAAGLPSFRVYDLRHTYASLLLSAGVPLLYVAQQLGHTKPTTTLKYYARWIPSGQANRVNVLDDNTVLTPAVSAAVASVPIPA